MYFFDSDVCIEIMRGHLPRAQEIRRKSSPDLFGVPAIVEAELLYGAENSNNPEEGLLFCREPLVAAAHHSLRFPVRRLLRAESGPT